MKKSNKKENIKRMPRLYFFVKRFFDILVGILGIILLIPVSIIVKIIN